LQAYDPELYALVHRGNPGDVDFYVERCTGHSVLELGCGYGRLLGPLAQVARRYVGLELDDGLRALAEAALQALDASAAARVEVLGGDMREFDLAERFERILIPYSGLYCLGGKAGVLRCLKAARAHLRDDGRLLADAYAADAFHAEARPGDLSDDHLEPVCQVQQGRQLLEVYEQSSWNRRAQRMDVTYCYELPDGEVVHEGRIRHDYLLSSQLEKLLRDAGFAHVELAEDFDREAPDPEAELIVIEASPR